MIAEYYLPVNNPIQPAPNRQDLNNASDEELLWQARRNGLINAAKKQNNTYDSNNI